MNSDDLWVQNFVGRGATFSQGLCDNKLPEQYNKNLIFWAGWKKSYMSDV
jgi:hypothetical protein